MHDREDLPELDASEFVLLFAMLIAGGYIGAASGMHYAEQFFGQDRGLAHLGMSFLGAFAGCGVGSLGAVLIARTLRNDWD